MSMWGKISSKLQALESHISLILIILGSGTTISIGQILYSKIMEIFHNELYAWAGVLGGFLTTIPVTIYGWSLSKRSFFPKRAQGRLSEYKNAEIRLIDLIDDKDDTISNVKFERCTIVGPAVICFSSEKPSAINNLVIKGEEAKSIIRLHPEQKAIQGVIIIRGCTFMWCEFKNIGFVSWNNIHPLSNKPFDK